MLIGISDLAYFLWSRRFWVDDTFFDTAESPHFVSKRKVIAHAG